MCVLDANMADAGVVVAGRLPPQSLSLRNIRLHIHFGSYCVHQAQPSQASDRACLDSYRFLETFLVFVPTTASRCATPSKTN